MAVNAKARVAQLTGSRSITAAAELSGNLWVFLLSVESAPLWLAGLKFGSRHRRAGLGPAPTAGRLQICRRGRSQTGPPGKENTAGRGTPQGGFSCPFGAIHLQPLPYSTTAQREMVSLFS